MNKDNEHHKALEAKEAELKEETNILNPIINTALIIGILILPIS